jgi:hypothetical protein
MKNQGHYKAKNEGYNLSEEDLSKEVLKPVNIPVMMESVIKVKYVLHIAARLINRRFDNNKQVN